MRDNRERTLNICIWLIELVREVHGTSNRKLKKNYLHKFTIIEIMNVINWKNERNVLGNE